MGILNKIFRGEDDGMGYADNTERETAEEAVEGELALDVYQTKDNLVIKSTMAGVKPEDLDVTIADGQVVIKGQRKQESESKGEDYLLQECYWGSFYRSFTLPVDVDIDKAVADIKDGILTLVMPKSAKSRTKKIRVKQQDEE